MRYSMGFAVLSLVALAGCATPETKAPATAAAADSQDQSASTVKKPKNCMTGSHMCTAERQIDPSVGSMSGEALADALRGHTVSGQASSP